MKQQTTDRARDVLNHAMDIHAGSAICLGENNFLEKFYKSAPIGITVEGSNTLTRNLIIFGQGLNKSHPHIFNVFNSVQNDDERDFSKHFRSLVGDSIRLYIQGLLNNNSVSKVSNLGHFTFYKRMIDSQTMKFAALSNFVAMLGGQIKSNQTISALMADIMSNIYLANSVIYYTNEEGGDERIGAYCLYRLAIDTSDKINSVIFNYPTENRGMKLLLYLLTPVRVQFDFNKNRELMEHFKRNESDILCLLKGGYYIR